MRGITAALAALLGAGSLAVPAAAQLAADAQPPAEAPAADPRVAEFQRLGAAFAARQSAGDTVAAAALAEQMAALGAELLGAEDPDYLDMVERLVEYLEGSERRVEALALAQRLHAGRLAGQGPDDPRTVKATIILSSAHASGGDYERAEPLMVEALARAERVLGAEAPDTLLALTNLGVLRLEQGRYGEAEGLLQRALALAEKLGGADHEATLDALNALGALYRGQGRLDEAEPLLARVLDMRERTLGPADPQTLMSMNMLASVRTLLFDADSAEALFRRALAAAAPLGDDHPLSIDALDGLAMALLYKDQAREAVPLGERALAARERVQGATHPATLRALNSMASIYLFAGMPAKAEPLLVRAMAETQRRLGTEHPDFLISAENLVYARLRANLADLSALEPARQLLNGARLRRYGAKPAASATPDPRNDVRGRRGALWHTLFADAAMAAGRAGQGGAYPQLLAEVFMALQEGVSGEASASIARMAVRRYVEQRGGDLADLVREREELAGRWRTLSERITQSYADTSPEAGAERARLQAERAQAQTRIGTIDARIATDFTDYQTLVRPAPVQGPVAQQLLREDEALLLAVPGPFGTHVLVMTRDGGHWARSDWTQRDVEAAVERLRFDAGAQVIAPPEQLRQWEAERPAGGRLAFDRTKAHALYNAVVQPAEVLLKGKKRVYIVAGESLAALPFGMLVTEAPKGSDDDPAALRATAWLADRYALVQVPSIQALGLLRGAARNAAPGGFVGFGDPAFEGAATSRGALRGARRGAAAVTAEEVVTPGRSASGGLLANVAALRALEQLPGTARELQAMGEIFGPAGSRIFTRGQATEAQVRRADLSQARVVAFATHGLTPSDPVGRASASELFELAEPGLVLTPPAAASEADDGFLSASEVATLKLDADWVILSACNTATGDAATAGLSQLARAFFYAGARSLLASHWPVDDAVAAKLTVRTLALERSGTPRAEAFQQAMREIRTDPAQAEWAHPFYWAPFVLMGDGGGPAAVAAEQGSEGEEEIDGSDANHPGDEVEG